MRLTFGIMLFALAATLGVCSAIAKRSGKNMSLTASSLLLWIVPPVIGNAIIILSGQEILSTAGAYIYYIGMDFLMAGTLHFTFRYCRIEWPSRFLRNLVFGLLMADVVQLLLNPMFHHAFDLIPLEVDGFNYYKLSPHLGQTFHRVVDYGILAGILGVFTVKAVRSPRLQRERYSVILITIVLVTVWETAYIFSGTPIDRSMIGFGVFGLLVFYFSLYYRPMRLLDRMLGGVVSEQPDAMFFFDPNQKCIWMNEAGERLLHMEGQDPAQAGNALAKRFGNRHPGENSWSDQVLMNGEDGQHVCRLSKRPLMDNNRRMNGFYITVRDETEEQRAMEQKLYNARHDRLTGLFNRDYLYERTRELIDQYPDKEFLIVYADVSNFKMINDIYGYTFGDYALQRVADWVPEGLPENSVCGRLGGDTFGVCLPAGDFNQEMMEQKLMNFLVDDGTTKHRLLIHAGVYRITDRETDVSVMFDRAHMAVSTIKEEAHIITCWYDEEMREQVIRNRQISNELKDALWQGQIRPWLQPIVDRNGRTVGAEALVRWIHPIDGIRAPGTFIPVFERNGMIAELDLHMWRCSCSILQRWQKEGNDRFISVNISPKDFQFLNVGEELKKLVAEYGVDPRKLRLEITETVMMTNAEERIRMLEDLHSIGFIIEMDDFGSGYSSLNMLKDMPVDVLKIDMAFLRKTADRGGRRKVIVREIISLAKELGIVSLTEGVETEEQYDQLQDMGCQLYQGYYFFKPVPPEDFEKQYGTAG